MKIGIIGGGAAGLVAAWLLEEHYEVLLFEKSEQLGGHANTEYININDTSIPIDTGFEFFNSFNFPYLCKLLNILNVPMYSYQLSHTYYTNKSDLLVLPIFQEKTIHWESLTIKNLFNLLQFKYLINRGRVFVATHNKATTLQKFVDTLFLTDNFKEHLFYPFLAAGWGDSVASFKKYSAFGVLNWVVKNEPNKNNRNIWKEIVGGTAKYIHALANQLLNTSITTLANITKITADHDGYSIKLSEQTYEKIDYLILATNAHDAAHLLNSLPGTQELVKKLQKIEYFPTTIAIHGDQRLMPSNKADWSIANIYFDGTYSNLTIYKSWKSQTPIFRSWLTPNIIKGNLPKPLYVLKHFFHARTDNNYFQAQETIKKYQGINNIWLAGIYVSGQDSHESTIISAINIAKRLAPKSQRLKKIIEVV